LIILQLVLWFDKDLTVIEQFFVQLVLSPYFVDLLEHCIGRQKHQDAALGYTLENFGQGPRKTDVKLGIITLIEGKRDLLSIQIVLQDTY
jgi:hypothetical protein